MRTRGGLFIAGALVCALAACGGDTKIQECEVDADCDDGVACTTDTCAAGSCSRSADDTQCDDGVFCNGTETCAAFAGCVVSQVPACDDGVACTADSCDEANQQCVNTPADSLCDDGLWCNGSETCNATSGCESGTAPSCDDGLTCTTDSCNEDTDACDNAAGTEVCDGMDNDCDGDTDEGVLSPCGTCDTTCDQAGSAGVDLMTDTVTGVEYDMVEGGISIETVVRPNFLWLPNTAESTFSKWDPTTSTELARYRVGLAAGECPGTCCWTDGCNMPSRVAVDGRGDAYIASRGFSMQGTVTKVAADIADCVDRDGSMAIETSTSSTPMSYDADECVLWTSPVGAINAVLRAIAVDRGDLDRPEGYVWVGGYNTQLMYQVNPDTGATLNQVDVAPLRPYGAIAVGDIMWVSGLSDNGIAYFDTTEATPTATFVPFPAFRGCSQSYGITADAQGRIWLSGWGCQDALGYDPATNEWTRVTGFGANAGRGITADTQGRIWMPYGGDGQSSLAWWNASDFTAGGTLSGAQVNLVTMPAGATGPSAIGEDADGYIWLGHHVSSTLVRIDPGATGSLATVSGANRVYTYSDFTGSVRRVSVGTGYYSTSVSASCATPTVGNLTWDGTADTGASISFYLKVGGTEVLLGSTADTSPIDVASVLSTAGVTPEQTMRLGAVLTQGSASTPPVLRDIALQWFCP